MVDIVSRAAELKWRQAMFLAKEFGGVLWFIGIAAASLFVAYVGTAYLPCLSENFGEPFVRFTGLLMQVAGVSTVWLKLRDTKRQFKMPSPWQMVKAKWHAMPRAASNQALTGVGGAWLAGNVHAAALSTSNLTTFPSMEQRIADLARELEQIRNTQRNESTRLDREVAQRQAADTAGQEARLAAEADLNDALRKTATGSVNLDTLGMVWVLLGTLLTSVSPELGGIAGYIELLQCTARPLN